MVGGRTVSGQVRRLCPGSLQSPQRYPPRSFAASVGASGQVRRLCPAMSQMPQRTVRITFTRTGRISLLLKLLKPNEDSVFYSSRGSAFVLNDFPTPFSSPLEKKPFENTRYEGDEEYECHQQGASQNSVKGQNKRNPFHPSVLSFGNRAQSGAVAGHYVHSVEKVLESIALRGCALA